jgi:heme/copper-type cytochrome/quinol oxidase subunit 3
MAETTAAPPPSGLSPAEEEAAFYHEASLNATWTGTRLAIGGLTFLFGAFIFAFFYLRSLNSHHLWYPRQINGVPFNGPGGTLGVVITLLVVVSAVVQTLVLQRIKAGHKGIWIQGAIVALALGLAAISLQVYQLTSLNFWPGSSGFASVFTGYCPVFVAVAFCVLVWLEMLIMRCRPIPEIAFVEQPPTYAEAFAVQRFQASLSAFTVTWNYLAVVAVVAWILFYLVH